MAQQFGVSALLEFESLRPDHSKTFLKLNFLLELMPALGWCARKGSRPSVSNGLFLYAFFTRAALRLLMDALRGNVSQFNVTSYFLEAELIGLDERLCRTLDRTMRLRDRALEQNEVEEAETLLRINKLLLSAKRQLEKLSRIAR